jgi:B12-binding domain/radical SAM domain protein
MTSLEIPLTIILRYRRGNSYGLHALLGALESELSDREGAGGFQLAVADTPSEAADAILQAHRLGRRSLVCWSFYSTDFLESSADVAAVRAATSEALEVIHIAGGVHATAEPESTLNAGFDLVAIGEGEHTFVELVRALLEGSPLDAVPGLLLRDPSGRPRRTRPAVRHPLDRFPSFSASWRKFNPIEITRGCIYACSFCQTPFMFKARFRHRSVENVRAHVGQMKSVGLTDVRFITPTSLSYGTDSETPNLAAVEELLSGVREELGPVGRIFFGSFPSELRPEHVTPEALRLLRRYVANDNVIIGAQTGSKRLLDDSHRGHDVESIRRAVAICREEGFKVNVDFIFGMPSETQEEAMASVALAEQLADAGARIHGHTFMPLPGTPWRHEAPGEVEPGTLRALHRLVSSGKLYGQWEAQQQVAADLAPLSTSRKRAKTD